ncbi:MAG: ParB/RepB/Spo0J family partition protein [Nannocystaceae bacterium]
MSPGKRNALGRGLGALIPTKPPEPEAAPAPAATPGKSGLRTLAIEQLRPNPEQPRRRFDPTALRELADSIALHGILQPIIVTPLPDARGEYLIVAGERRWRAAQLAGVHDVPVVVRDTPESERLELAMIENLQRQDLNPIEEALALRQLMDVRGCTQEQLAERLGKDRSTISNALRLLRLPPKVQAMVEEGALSMGHARALLGLGDDGSMIELAREAVSAGLSVRALEREVRRRQRAASEEPPQEDPEQRKRALIVRDLQDRLRRSLGVRVLLKTDRKRKGAGVIEVPYGDLDELDRLLNVMLARRGS